MIKINRIIKYLVLADIAFWSGWGLVTPVFAIFIVDRIIGGSAMVVGIATAIYWVTRSLMVLPAGTLLDKYKGEKDDYIFLVLGNLIAALIPFGYIFAEYPWHIYVLQFFYGLSMAMSLAAWRAIFTKSIDKGKEATEWALDDTMLSMGCGFAGLISGILVSSLGYEVAFSIAGLSCLVSVIFILFLKDDIHGVARHGKLEDIFEDK